MPSRGERVPLVLLPGMNCSEALFVEPVAGLEDERPVESRVLRESTLDAQVQVLLDTLPDRFALAGLSLGGIVAMAIARTAPERVAGLMLISTNSRGPTPAQRDGWAATIDAVEQGRSARDVQRDLLPVLLSPAAQADAALVDRTLAMADEVGEEALIAQLRLQATRVDERPGLAAALHPVAVLCGDADALCPVSNHQEIASLVPPECASFTTLPGRGHLLTLEDPHATRSVLDPWLARVDRAAGA